MATKMRDIVPVVQDGTPVGAVSIGDLVLEEDHRSALSHLLVAPPDS
jgi:hypothetical protein